MTKPNDQPVSLLEVSQQDLAQFLDHDDPKLDPLYALARACLPHTIAAAKEVKEGPATGHLPELLTFLKTYGVFDDAGADTEYFQRGQNGRGWVLTKLADRMRGNGNRVIVQNLAYGPGSDTSVAVNSGRVRSPSEQDLLSKRMVHGGQDKAEWIKAIGETLREGGQAIPVLSIPRMDGQGMSGHSVLVTQCEDDMVEYFDADGNAIARYENNGLENPGISRVEGEKRLMYRQPVDQFTQRMTGELMHVFSEQT